MCTRAVLSILSLGLFGCLLIGQSVHFPTNRPTDQLNQLTDKERAQGWILLFNGKNLNGWETDGRGSWRVSDGTLVSEKGPSHLFSTTTYRNVEVSWYVCAYDVAVPKRRFGNSGVFLRAVKTGENFPVGYEIQVDPYDQKNPTGGVYGLAPGTLLVDAAGQWKPEALFDVHEGKWIHQRAKIEENRIQIWVNGEQTLDWADPEDRFHDAGYIALQNHHETDIVLFASVKLRNLD